MDGKRSFHIDINSTKNCNLRCTYCFEVKNNEIKNRSFEHVDSLIKFIEDFRSTDYYKSNYYEMVINFWGGEPTLNKPLFKRIVSEYIGDTGIRFFMYSNGYHVDDFFIGMFRQIQKMKVNGHPKIVVQISYDGTPIHDFDRIDVNGEGSSGEIKKTIQKLRDNGIFYVLKSTIQPKNFKHLYEAYLDVINLDGNGYFPTIDLHEDYGEDEYNKYNDDLYENLYKIAAYEIKHNVKMFKWFIKNRSLCSAGNDMLAIDINGNIQPCHGGLYTDYDEHLISNINDENVIEEVIKSSIKYKSFCYDEPIKCKECSVGFCLRCNAAHFTFSEKETYQEKWMDFNNQDYICHYFRIIDIVSRSVSQMR